MASTQKAALPDGITRKRVLRGARGWVGRFSWSPAGDRIVVPSSDGSVRVWEMTERGVALTLTGQGRALAAVFSPRGRLIVSGGTDRAVDVWSAATGDLRRHLPAHAPVYALGFSPDNATLAAGCADGVVRLWASRGWSSGHNLEGDTAVTDLAWMPAGRLLACAHENGPVVLWNVDLRRRQAVWERLPGLAHGLACSPGGQYLAGGYGDRGAVAVWDVETGRLVRVLESASGAVGGLSFSADGRLLAVVSRDGTTRLWSCKQWEPASALPGEARQYWLPGVAFHPKNRLLAVPTREDRVVEVFEIGDLHDPAASESAVRHATAKVVLLGDARAGKTTLGHRLSTGHYREHASTHGQQIWMLDALGWKREDGTEQEVLLWDLAGQKEYRPLHTLFLGDADVILLVFDASDVDEPLDGVRYWLRALERAGCRDRPMILVGAKSDGGSSGLTPAEIQTFCSSNGIRGGYVATSALKGSGLDELSSRLKDMILQAQVTTTTTTATFRRAKQAVLALKSSASAHPPILTFPELRAALSKVQPDLRLSERDLTASLGDLVKHGQLQEISLGSSRRGVLLHPEMLYNTAASLVLQAKTERHGLGAVEETAVFAGSASLPDFPEVSTGDRRKLLDAAVRMLLERAVCVRETLDRKTLLVFPELVHRSRLRGPDGSPPMEDLVIYTVEGAVENLFAMLTVRAGYADFVTGVRHWRSAVDYEVEGGTWLVLRADQNDGRVLRLVLGRRGADPGGVLDKLAALIERFIKSGDFALARFQSTTCPSCHDRPSLVEIERVVRDGRAEMGCALCGRPIPLDTNTMVDSREREGSSLHEDKERADLRFKFQQALTSLKAYLAAEGAPARRCTLTGDVERQWAKRWIRDVEDAGIHIDARQDEATADPRGASGLLWLQEAPTEGGAPSTGKRHILAPPGSDISDSSIRRGAQLWDFTDPARYFRALCEMLFLLHHVPGNERRALRPRPQQSASPLGPRGKQAAPERPPASVVCIYAPEDASFAAQFARHFRAMKDPALVLWLPADIPAGAEQAAAVERAIAGASIVVALVSADLLADPLWDLANECHSRRSPAPPLVPVLVRSVTLPTTPLANKQRLPRDGTAINAAPDRDGAWQGVVTALRGLLASD